MNVKKMIVSVSLATLLVGCSDKEDNSAKKENTDPTIVNISDSGGEKEQPKNDAKQNTDSTQKETPVIPPEKAKEVRETVLEQAKNSSVIKEESIKLEDDVVKVNLKFDEDSTEEEQAQFIFNYSIFLDMEYPDKEVDFNVEK